MNSKIETQKSFKEYCKESGIQKIAQKASVDIKPSISTPKIPTIAAGNSNYNEPITYNLLEEALYYDSYYKDGQKLIVANLKRGKYKIVQILDLHNYRQSEALALLEHFINNNFTLGNTCIKIIHGKGLNSKDGFAILRSIVRRFLEHHPRILAYTNALEKDGGDGVTLVKLKNSGMRE